MRVFFILNGRVEVQNFVESVAGCGSTLDSAIFFSKFFHGLIHCGQKATEKQNFVEGKGKAP